LSPYTVPYSNICAHLGGNRAGDGKVDIYVWLGWHILEVDAGIMLHKMKRSMNNDKHFSPSRQLNMRTEE
jgi:hypothetical protein